MVARICFRLSAVVACLMLALAAVAAHAQGDNSGRGRKYKAPPPASTIAVTVLKADNGKPIEDAAVIFHPIEGDKDKGALELKTNEDGKAIIDVIPIGDTVVLQVIAKGFQTYGQEYKIDKASMSMQVKLNRPGGEYSIYKNNNSASNGSGNGSGSNQKSNSSPNQPNNNSSGGNSSGSGNQQPPK